MVKTRSLITFVLIVNCYTQHLLDFGEAEGGTEEVALLDVPPPQFLAQLIELLHPQCGQLTRECATLQQTGAGFTHRNGTRERKKKQEHYQE